MNKQQEADYEIELLNAANINYGVCTHLIFLDPALDITNKVLINEDLFKEKRIIDVFSHLKSLNPKLKVLLGLKSISFFLPFLSEYFICEDYIK